MIEAKNIVYFYKAKRDKVILKQVSASFEEGIFYAIVGASGSGKTTFLSLLAGLDRPVSGNILYQGEDIRKKGLNYHRRHHISLVFQNYNLIDYLTAEENVRLGGDKNAGELLGQMGIPREDWKRNVMQLSGGQQQRVAIARALALKPDILCFDEPTSALDPELTGEVLKVIRTLAEQKTTMIIVTHEMAFARDVADQLIFMDGGVIVEQGDPHQVIDHPKEERTKQFLTRYAQG